MGCLLTIFEIRIFRPFPVFIKLIGVFLGDGVVATILKRSDQELLLRIYLDLS